MMKTPLLAFAFALAPAIAACDTPKADVAVDAAATATTPVTTTAAPPASTVAAPKIKKRTSADCDKGLTVSFFDSNLEKEVRKKLQNDAKPISKSDLAQVKSLNLTTWGATDQLDPCLMPLFTGVHALYFGPGEVDDLGPLITLGQLETLRASPSKVQNLQPLERLVRMDVLILSDTNVTDIGSLKSLVNLTELSLDNDAVTDLSPISACTKLEMLSIKNTKVTDLSPLKDMKKLKKLYIKGTTIEDTSVLSPLASTGLKVFRE